jgi:hypothetical protein
MNKEIIISKRDKLKMVFESRVCRNNNNKGKVSYEELKNCLGVEDLFFDLVLEPCCKEFGMEFSFEGEYIIFNKKEKL